MSEYSEWSVVNCDNRRNTNLKRSKCEFVRPMRMNQVGLLSSYLSSQICSFEPEEIRRSVSGPRSHRYQDDLKVVGPLAPGARHEGTRAECGHPPPTTREGLGQEVYRDSTEPPGIFHVPRNRKNLRRFGWSTQQDMAARGPFRVPPMRAQ